MQKISFWKNLFTILPSLRACYRVAVALLVVLFLLGAGASLVKPPAVQAGQETASSSDPYQALKEANSHVQKALVAAKTGDLTTARQEYKLYDENWSNFEDGIRAASKESYRTIEEKMSEVERAFANTSPNQIALVTALQNLAETNETFIAKKPADAGVSSGGNEGNLVKLLAKLDEARQFQAKGDYPNAAGAIKAFQQMWLDVEGQVKTRSGEDYTATENDMALAYTQLTQNSPESRPVMDRMYKRLEPYLNNTSYGIFDASIIIIREGLEALLIVVALLAFLKKSGNASKQGWIWAGAGGGLLVSLLLAVIVGFVFVNAINASNREVIEGVSGLVAAILLLYVSYWLHSKSQLGGWQKYIREKSSEVLAKGSLFGLALLSFLAIFREGAETVLFYIGIGSSINLSDLLLGVGLGSGLLIGLGVLLLVVGLRVPMRPFFMVASFLIFFLCFKFVGTALHDLQVAGWLPSTSAKYLPEQEFLGLSPTWETTLAQLVLLVIGIVLVFFNSRKPKARSDTDDSRLSPPSASSA